MKYSIEEGGGDDDMGGEYEKKKGERERARAKERKRDWEKYNRDLRKTYSKYCCALIAVLWVYWLLARENL